MIPTASTLTAPADAALLRLEGIDKRFPGVHALKEVNLDLRPGEVHVLLGENGAGKSTLMKLVIGSLTPDRGRIVVRGEERPGLTPELSQSLGIGMVHQELSLIPALTVAENILINRMPRNRLGAIDWVKVNRFAERALARLGVAIRPTARVHDLTVSEQQLVEIARVLSRECKVLLLDEPTSALSEDEAQRLFDAIRTLQADGVGIIYISHRLHEVPLIGQRVSVMRDGRVVATLPVAEANRDRLVRLMIGNELEELYPKKAVRVGDEILRLEGLTVTGELHDVSFALRQGEVLGVFGRMGAGQAALAEALFGLRPRSAGRCYIDGEETFIACPSDAIRHKLAFLKGDRRSSLVPMQPIPVNITLPTVGQQPIFQTLSPAQERSLSRRYVDNLHIRPPRLDRPVAVLSGGNQQKVLLARWMCSGARVLILEEPTRGIDVGAKAEVFSLISDLAAQGAGIILISSEMPEVLAMSDRILVIRNGYVSAALERDEASQERLLKSAS